MYAHTELQLKQVFVSPYVFTVTAARIKPIVHELLETAAAQPDEPSVVYLVKLQLLASAPV